MDKYGIIGYPLDHSFSPVIHNQAFKNLKIEACYEKYQIAPQDFPKNIPLLKSSDIMGFNVTVPYKQKIIPYLDEIEPIAKKVGAVNTIKKIGNKWIGYNTDLYGFLLPLQNHINVIKSILVIGAGGAANAVCYALLSESAIVKKIDIVNRTKDKAQSLCSKLKTEFNIEFESYELNEVLKDCQKYDLIVNTTNVGMGELKDKYPIKIDNLIRVSTIVYDLIYNPKQTLLLESANNQKLKTINGLLMLIGQAGQSFKIWTGQEYPQNIISEKLFY